MEDLLQLLRGIRSDHRSVISELSTAKAVVLIDAAFKVRIYELADAIAKGEVSGDQDVGSAIPDDEIPVPVKDKWDFLLGDRVIVKCSLDDFRSIQKRTIGWNKKLENVHLRSGIVTDIITPHENVVQVHFPDIHASSAVYAGVLEHEPEESISTSASAFKVGDLVTTKSDEKVLKILQRHLPDIPTRLIGRKGRVIGVTPDVVFVTYDGHTSFAVKSAALMLSQDKTPIKITEKEHPRGLNIGEKVVVIGSLKRLILNQKRKGGWSQEMCNLVGKRVVITHINDDDSINVALEGNRSWRINSDSVLKVVESAQVEVTRDLEFMPNDKVKLKMDENIRRILDAKNIPLEFLEQLTATAVIEWIDDDMDAFIRFNCDQRINVQTPALKLASTSEAEEFDNNQGAVKSLKVGDEVMLDAGHHQYVMAILNECKAESDIVSALTTSAHVVGFPDRKLAVIEYKNGKRYKIKKKYLKISRE